MQTNFISKAQCICQQLCVIGLLLGATLVAHAENFDAGVFEFQKKLADSGNAQAQFKLGNMYETGRGVAADQNAAQQWYQKSAAQNFKPANNRLSYMQVKHSGVKPEHKAWLKTLADDANSGDGEASMILGEMHEQGIGMSKNLVQAQTEYKRATVKGIAGSESAYYAVTDLINKQKAQDEENRQAAERARKDDAEREVQRKKSQQEQDQQRLVQLKSDSEQRKLDEDRRRIEAQKRMLEEQREQAFALQKQKQFEAVAAKPAADAAKPAETFESDLCTGKAASFRTQCR